MDAKRVARRIGATSLLLAPNVIVYERLQSDFEGGKIFKTFPMVPRELEMFFDFAVDSI
ncbi:hypothetical protein B1R32_101175 [Abditibacterium utsteinense]|uniref:Uncharacterized protein n=1 Tax=Abditibacterium utsteinense TaxID=1960156 RepID=A0A2S8SXA4_9BACT|nr:hypothetical protein [Abditibacterium utsteinense]PQV65433.1 hypothetical protein B1R32_101175 [Abditibacterium utsteinense]